MHRRTHSCALTVLLAALLGLSSRPAAAAEAAAENPAPCTSVGALSFLCGPSGAEDLLRIEGTPWIIASGLAEGNAPGHLHLVQSRARTWQVAWPSPDARAAHDPRRFASCPTPPAAATFSAHGIALRHTRPGHDTLLVVNHGREAIEFFDIESHGAAPPRLTWNGCVPMPADVYLNSVAPLPDGGFVTTQFYTPSKGGMGAILTGALTGGLLEWHPGGPVQGLAGTDLVGANGILAAHGGQVLYVAAWGSREIVRFDRRGKALKKSTVKVEFAPDNLRWSADHRTVLVAGQKFQAGQSGPMKLDGWSIARLQPDSLAVTRLYDADAAMPMQGVSVAIEVDGRLWVGPFRGDRLGVISLPH